MQTEDFISSHLLENDILDKTMLQKLLRQAEASGQSLITILKESNLITEEQLTKLIADNNKIEFINLSPDMVNPMAAHMISYEIANEHNVIPIKKTDNDLLVAMSEPWDLIVRNQIRMRTGCEVISLAATPSAIRQAIRYHFNVRNITRQTITSMRVKQNANKKKQQHIESKSKSGRTESDPVTMLVSSIITSAIEAGASDIHIEPREPDIRVRYRIDGHLRDAISVPSSVQQELISHIKVQAEMDISERRRPQDGHITKQYNDNRQYDLRVSSLPIVGGEKIVIRILDQNTERWSFDKIVSLPNDNQKFRTLITNPYGIFLLTGPTGSGKTTTLYSVLQLLNTSEKNIVTVEDPVEYRLADIAQIQINPKAGMTFPTVLRSILRQDPDVILVGEIRDGETAEIAVSSALTGHLVLSTLHTNDAAGAISRLINLGVPRIFAASALLGTAAQRLIRTICPKCSQPYKASPQEAKELFGSSEQPKDIQLYRGAGCDYCYNSGYHGRKAIYEILCLSPEICEMVIESASDRAITQQAIKEGMNTLHKNGIKEVLKGTTTLEELRRFVEIGQNDGSV